MQEVWTRIRHSRTAMVGLGILVFFIGMAVFARWLAPYGPIDRVADTSNCILNVSCPLSPPSAQHPLGISDEGADIYSQVIWGSQISLIVGIFSAMVASVLGTAVGLVSGDRKSTRLNSSHSQISYAVFCLKKKKQETVLRYGLAISMVVVVDLGPQLPGQCDGAGRLVELLLACHPKRLPAADPSHTRFI